MQGVSRSKALQLAIEAYLHNGADNRSMQVSAELNELRITLDQQSQELILLKQKNEDLERLISAKDSEIQHLRYLTNDLRSLADNLASKVPMLTGPAIEKPKTKSWWQFWRHEDQSTIST